MSFESLSNGAGGEMISHNRALSGAEVHHNRDHRAGESRESGTCLCIIFGRITVRDPFSRKTECAMSEEPVQWYWSNVSVTS